MLEIFSGVNTNLGVERHQRGLNKSSTGNVIVISNLRIETLLRVEGVDHFCDAFIVW